MTQQPSSKITAHVRLCIFMGAEMDGPMHALEHHKAFQTAFIETLPVVKGPPYKSGACLDVELPEDDHDHEHEHGHKPHASAHSSSRLSIFTIFAHPYHNLKAEQTRIACINKAFTALRDRSEQDAEAPTIKYAVTADAGRDGWCSPNPLTNQWERFRTYKLQMSVGNGAPVDVTMAAACAEYRKSLPPGTTLTEAEEKALVTMARQPVMAVFTAIEEDPTT